MLEGEAGAGIGWGWDLQGAEGEAELRKEAGMLEAEGITPEGGILSLERQRAGGG